jgi:hypothetical protein
MHVRAGGESTMTALLMTPPAKATATPSSARRPWSVIRTPALSAARRRPAAFPAARIGSELLTTAPSVHLSCASRPSVQGLPATASHSGSGGCSLPRPPHDEPRATAQREAGASTSEPAGTPAPGTRIPVSSRSPKKAKSTQRGAVQATGRERQARPRSSKATNPRTSDTPYTPMRLRLRSAMPR